MTTAITRRGRVRRGALFTMASICGLVFMSSCRAELPRTESPAIDRQTEKAEVKELISRLPIILGPGLSEDVGARACAILDTIAGYDVEIIREALVDLEREAVVLAGDDRFMLACADFVTRVRVLLVGKYLFDTSGGGLDTGLGGWVKVKRPGQTEDDLRSPTWPFEFSQGKARLVGSIVGLVGPPVFPVEYFDSLRASFPLRRWNLNE